MQTLTHAMTPRCIGRYLIDLPAGMVLSGWGGLKAQGVNIEVAPLNESLFRWRYEQREAELRAAHLDAHPDPPVLKEIIPLRGATGGGVIAPKPEGPTGRGPWSCMPGAMATRSRCGSMHLTTCIPNTRTKNGQQRSGETSRKSKHSCWTYSRAYAAEPTPRCRAIRACAFTTGSCKAPRPTEKTSIWTTCSRTCRMCRYRSTTIAILFRKIRCLIAARTSMRICALPMATRYARASANRMTDLLSMSG